MWVSHLVVWKETETTRNRPLIPGDPPWPPPWPPVTAAHFVETAWAMSLLRTRTCEHQRVMCIQPRSFSLACSDRVSGPRSWPTLSRLRAQSQENGMKYVTVAFAICINLFILVLWLWMKQWIFWLEATLEWPPGTRRRLLLSRPLEGWGRSKRVFGRGCFPGLVPKH